MDQILWLLQFLSHSLLPDLSPILGTEESGFVSQQNRAMSWASLLPTAVPHEKYYLIMPPDILLQT